MAASGASGARCAKQSKLGPSRLTCVSRPRRFVSPSSPNADRLTCLDVAVLLRNARMVGLLQAHAARESSPGECADLRPPSAQRRSRLATNRARTHRPAGPREPAGGALRGNPTPRRRFGRRGSIKRRAESAVGRAARGESCGASGPPTRLELQRCENICRPCRRRQVAAMTLIVVIIIIDDKEKQRQLCHARRRLDLFMQMRYQFERLREYPI